jgi:hypothetical protein
MSHGMIAAAFAVGLMSVSPAATAVELSPKAIASGKPTNSNSVTPREPPQSTKSCCSAIRPNPDSIW